MSVQRCDLEESEHCEMTACVASRVVSPGIVRHRPDARFSSWPTIVAGTRAASSASGAAALSDVSTAAGARAARSA